MKYMETFSDLALNNYSLLFTTENILNMHQFSLLAGAKANTTQTGGQRHELIILNETRVVHNISYDKFNDADVHRALYSLVHPETAILIDSTLSYPHIRRNLKQQRLSGACHLGLESITDSYSSLLFSNANGGPLEKTYKTLIASGIYNLFIERIIESFGDEFEQISINLTRHFILDETVEEQMYNTAKQQFKGIFYLHFILLSTTLLALFAELCVFCKNSTVPLTHFVLMLRLAVSIHYTRRLKMVIYICRLKLMLGYNKLKILVATIIGKCKP